MMKSTGAQMARARVLARTELSDRDQAYIAARRRAQDAKARTAKNRKQMQNRSRRTNR